jgi:hypothetical protein
MERETTFHDTVPAPIELLGKYRKKAVRQKDIVLDFFRRHPENNYTPPEVQFVISPHITMNVVSEIGMNEVRRSITDLTKEGRLNKCQWSERRMGKFGVDNRTWRYNIEYVSPINPPKK